MEKKRNPALIGLLATMLTIATMAIIWSPFLILAGPVIWMVMWPASTGAIRIIDSLYRRYPYLESYNFIVGIVLGAFLGAAVGVVFCVVFGIVYSFHSRSFELAKAFALMGLICGGYSAFLYARANRKNKEDCLNKSSL